MIRSQVAILMASMTLAIAGVARADSPPEQVAATYADLADLADSASLVIRARPGKLIALGDGPRLSAGATRARFYAEAKTIALIYGDAPIGKDVRYIVELPLDSRGHPDTRARKGGVLLFARAVPAAPGEVQLVAPDGELAWSAAIEGRIKALLGEFANRAGAPSNVTGVREADHTSGTLAGEGETQLFFATQGGDPVVATIRRHGDGAPEWRISFGEVVGGDAFHPAPETLRWYRIACFLPAGLPDSALASTADSDRPAAARDYAFLRDALGPCPRARPR